MKTASTLIVALIGVAMLSSTATHAGGFTTSYPPEWYDRPYTGELTIKRLATERDVFNACPNAFKNAPAGHATAACAAHNETQCEIFILTESAMKKYNASFALTLRHELAHCNGWPGDHSGGTKVPVSTRVEMPKLPASTKELPAYPPLVCVTPEWKPEPCKERSLISTVSTKP